MTLAGILKRLTVKQILKDREVIEPELYDYARAEKKSSYLAYLTRTLGEKVLKIKRNYNIIPLEWGPLKELHKGDVLKLRRYDSSKDALEDNATPERLFIVALAIVEYGKYYVGLEWQGISKTSAQFKITPFSELDQALIIFMNQDKKNELEQIIVKPYTNTQYAPKLGGRIVAWVPSVSKKELEKYRIGFSHVPLKFKDDKKRDEGDFVWFNLNSDHGNCYEQTYYPLHYGRLLRKDVLRTGDEKFFDAHEISGYWEIMKFFKYMHENLRVSINPFFFLNEYGFKLMNVMKTQIVKEYVSDGKIKLRPLNDKEINVLLGDQFAKQRELLERIRASYIGSKIYNKFFNPENLNFAVWKNGKFSYK